MEETMAERVWAIDQDAFVDAWNGSGSLPEVAAKVRALAGDKPVPRWAILARALAIKKGGRGMKPLEPRAAA